MLLAKLFRGYKLKNALDSFRKNSLLGTRANIHHTARCTNSGEKEQVVIASHSVVTKDVAPYSIVAGNPQEL